MDKFELLIGTTNPGKVREISAVVSDLPVRILTPADFEIVDDVEETGLSYRENATIKARYYHNKANVSTLGEDSGIVVEALKDQLGVHTRRWGAGAKASDAEWLDYFMQVMQNFPLENARKAKFVSHMCLIIDGKEEHFYGETTGFITNEVLAPLYPGLPLSSVFRPEGFDLVYSALSEEAKNSISHRGKAIKQVKDYLILNFL